MGSWAFGFTYIIYLDLFRSICLVQLYTYFLKYPGVGEEVVYASVEVISTSGIERRDEGLE